MRRSPVLALCSNCCQLISLCFQKSFSLGTNLFFGPEISAAIRRSLIACVHFSNSTLSPALNINLLGEKSTPNLLRQHKDKRLRQCLQVECDMSEIQKHNFTFCLEYCECVDSQNGFCVLLRQPPIIEIQKVDFCIFQCFLEVHLLFVFVECLRRG